MVKVEPYLPDFRGDLFVSFLPPFAPCMTAHVQSLIPTLSLYLFNADHCAAYLDFVASAQQSRLK